MNLKELDRIKIGERIKSRRNLLNMSREELADRLDLSAKFISDVEYGDKGISVKTLYGLKQVLGVSADFLLEGNDETEFSEEKKKMLSENIMGSLSVCSVKQLGVMEQMARLYVESITDKDKD
ncbi:MAG: helix-turn-helix domain-containing protein [Anaerovoracaceae bacterium]